MERKGLRLRMPRCTPYSEVVKCLGYKNRKPIWYYVSLEICIGLSSLDVNNGIFLTECFVNIELTLLCLACNKYL